MTNACNKCNKHPARDGFKSCEKCAKISRDSKRKSQSKRRVSGLCIQCGIRPPLVSEHYCGLCLRQRAKTKRDRYFAVKDEVFSNYGGYKCNCCGETTSEFLTIDHIHGGGKQHRKEIKIDFYLWLKRNNFPDGFQVLCMNCQFGRKKCGECPHRSYAVDAEYF